MNNIIYKNENDLDEIESDLSDKSLVEAVESFNDGLEAEVLLNDLKKQVEISISEMTQAARVFLDSKASFERDTRLISESTAALERYWRQAHWYQGLVGMGVTLILCGAAFGAYYIKSADRMLSRANVRLTSVPGEKGVRLTLSGEKIIASGRSDHQVVVEFSR